MTEAGCCGSGAIRKVLHLEQAEFDPRAYLKPAREAMKQVCIARMTSFGQAGQGPRVTPHSLADMKKVYATTC